jgi:tetratricopeptide (TPR) repeat protein
VPAALALALPTLAQLKGRPPEGAALVETAPLLAQSGRAGEAERLLDAYAATAVPPNARNVGRTVAYGRAVVALAGKDFATAIRELTAAQSSLSPRPRSPVGPGQHVEIWFALGEAHLGAGNSPEARRWFDRIVSGPYERAQRPVEFVRSLYYLATIDEAAGDQAKAIESYRRFLGYWGDGEIDRDKVEIARRKLRGQS